LAWVAALAGAWLLAASCRTTTRDLQLQALAPATPPDTDALVARPSLRVGVRVAARQSSLSATSGIVVHGASTDARAWKLRELARASFEPVGDTGRVRLRETGDVLLRAIV